MESLGKVVEGVTKVGAVVATISLVMAFIYNLGYFNADWAWLEYLTLSDHINTAIFFVPVICASSIPSALLLVWIVRRRRSLQMIDDPDDRESATRKLTLMAGAIGLVLGVVVVVAVLFIWEGESIYLVAVFAIPMGVALWAAMEMDRRTSSSQTRVIIWAVVAFASFVGASFVTGHVHSRNPRVPVVRIDTPVGVVEGRLIRMIDAGVILRQSPTLTVLVPKAEIKKLVKDQSAPPVSNRR
ncbi:MAG: hypothetical protein KF889_04830 [Alphaproteobacteria bacterium]|nr:hypothetical protein [Alphaproteobacteria bacterium]MCW5742193.1 hypothetical protein [Alphaproteobacteria bacterium]